MIVPTWLVVSTSVSPAPATFVPLTPSEVKVAVPKSASVDCTPLTVGASSIHSAVDAGMEYVNGFE